MCGLFGAIGTCLDWPRLRAAAFEAGRRGPQAWGVAWLRDGRVQVHTQAGKLTGEVESIEARVAGAVAVIGQSRLATSGTYLDPRNNPPFVVEQTALAHNGNIYNERMLIWKHHLKPQTACDSEVLAQLVPYGKGTLLERVVWAITQVDTRSPLAVLALDATGMVAVRQWQPLYKVKREGAVYLSSRAFGSGSEMLPTNQAFYWSHDGHLAAQVEVKRG